MVRSCDCLSTTFWYSQRLLSFSSVNDNFYSVGSSLDFDFCNSCAVQFFLEVCSDLMIFYQIISEVSFSIPFRIPVFNNTDSQAVWINFLSHDMSSLFLV